MHFTLKKITDEDMAKMYHLKVTSEQLSYYATWTDLASNKSEN